MSKENPSVPLDAVIAALTELRDEYEAQRAQANSDQDYGRVTFELARKIAISDALHAIALVDIKANYKPVSA